MWISLRASLRARVPEGLSLTKELAWITLGQVVAAAGGVAGVKWLTRRMDSAVYGELGLALTVITLVQQTVGGPIAQAVMRHFAPAREECSLPEYFRAVFRMLRQSALAVAIVGSCALALMWMSGSVKWIPAAVATLVIALLSGYNLAFEAVQSASRSRRNVAWHQSLLQWLRPLLALAVFARFGVSVESALGGYAIATALVVCSQWFLMRSCLGEPFAQMSGLTSSREGAIDRRMLEYAWPFASWGLLCWSQLASDRWLLAVFQGPAAVGAYTVCYQLGYYPLVLASMSLGGLATPILFKIAGSGDDAARVQSAVRANLLHLLGLLAVTACAAAVTIGYGRVLLQTFSSSAYASFAPNLPVLVVAGGLFACGQAASLVLLLEGQSSRMVGAKVGTAIAGVIMNLIGTYLYGVPGAAWAALGFGVIYLITMLGLTGRAQSSAWNAGWANQAETGA